jgi:hypothetical protein
MGARRNYEEALRIFSEANDVFAIVTVRLNLARVELAEGKTEVAKQLIKEADKEAKRIEAYSPLAAWAAYVRGDFHQHRSDQYSPEAHSERNSELLLASKSYEESARLYRETNDRQAASSLEAASYALREFDEKDSRRYFAEASQLYRKVGLENEAKRVE